MVVRCWPVERRCSRHYNPCGEINGVRVPYGDEAIRDQEALRDSAEKRGTIGFRYVVRRWLDEHTSWTAAQTPDHVGLCEEQGAVRQVETNIVAARTTCGDQRVDHGRGIEKP